MLTPLDQKANVRFPHGESLTSSGYRGWLKDEHVTKLEVQVIFESDSWGKEICSVSFDLDFGGYEARALEETILQNQWNWTWRWQRNREGETGFCSYFSVPRIKQFLESTINFSAIRFNEFPFCFNHLGLYLPFAIRTILIQANWILTFLTFYLMKIHVQFCCAQNWCLFYSTAYFGSYFAVIWKGSIV